MVERESGGGRNLSAREAVEGIRGPLSNAELMERFKITAAGFADLLKQLFDKKLITEEDLARRGIQFRVTRRERGRVRPLGLPLPVPAPAKSPGDENEGFLDTETLTDLLAFKTPESGESPPEATAHPESPPEETGQPESLPKKSRFSIAGLFKKSS